MEECFNNDNLTVKYDQNNHILHSCWKTSLNMRDKDYRALFETYLTLLKKYKPTYTIINAINAQYAIPIETQDWINLKVYPLYKLFKTKKSAIIMSIDFIAQLSFEQITDDSSGQSLEVKFFENEEKAFDWIENKNEGRKHVA